jgi:transcriptional regulator NrdR family protein
MKCPHCDSEDVQRSHSQGLELIGRHLFARKRFRCRDCNHRWAAFAFDVREDKITIVLWAGIIIILVYLTLNLLRGII